MPARTSSTVTARDQVADCGPVLPARLSVSLTVPRSICRYSARTIQFGVSIASTPAPATQPTLVSEKLPVVLSLVKLLPHPLTRQFALMVVSTLPHAAPPVP